MKQADFDTMTGLLRRGVGEYKIKEHLKTYAHKKNLLIAVDLDGLKQINDTLGHSAGDEAIMGIANVIKSSFREKERSSASANSFNSSIILVSRVMLTFVFSGFTLNLLFAYNIAF